MNSEKGRLEEKENKGGAFINPMLVGVMLVGRLGVVFLHTGPDRKDTAGKTTESLSILGWVEGHELAEEVAR